jgi:hypothetical protein
MLETSATHRRRISQRIGNCHVRDFRGDLTMVLSAAPGIGAARATVPNAAFRVALCLLPRGEKFQDQASHVGPPAFRTAACVYLGWVHPRVPGKSLLNERQPSPSQDFHLAEKAQNVCNGVQIITSNNSLAICAG